MHQNEANGVFGVLVNGVLVSLLLTLNIFHTLLPMIIQKKAHHFPKKQGSRCAFITAWKVSVFGVILVRIFPYSDWIRTWIIPNMDNFYAAYTEVVFLQSCLQLNIKVFYATAEVEKKKFCRHLIVCSYSMD